MVASDTVRQSGSISARFCKWHMPSLRRQSHSLTYIRFQQFLIRSSDYEAYTQDLGPGLVQQGDLTDPYYFDFISYAQYATVNREITVNPAMVFEEQQPRDQGEDKPMEFVPVVVKRDPSLTDAMLPVEHSRRVGAAIIDRLEEIFQGTSSAIPTIEKGSKPDSGKFSCSAFQSMIQTSPTYTLYLPSKIIGIPGTARQSFSLEWVRVWGRCIHRKRR